MANLLSLSNELLIAIYSASRSIQSDAFLSTANRRLRAIWLEHNNHIIAGILKAQIQDYEDAIDLAVLEDTWTNSNPFASPIPISKHLPRILHNADLASRATTAWAAWIANLDSSNYRRHESFTSPHASYYMMRKLHLARTHSEAGLLPGLYETLRASSEKTVTTHAELCGWLLCDYSDDEDKVSQGVSKQREEWTEQDEDQYEQCGYVIKGDWEWVDEVLDTAMIDAIHGENRLEGIVFGDQ